MVRGERVAYLGSQGVIEVVNYRFVRFDNGAPDNPRHANHSPLHSSNPDHPQNIRVTGEKTFGREASFRNSGLINLSKNCKLTYTLSVKKRNTGLSLLDC